MSKNVIYLFITAAACLAVSACAKKDESSSSGAIAQDYLKLWMQEYHPGISASPYGVYILEDEPGTGVTWNSELPYSLLNVTIRGLNGKISSTGHESYARQLGTYQEGNYYGPVMTFTQTGYAGVEAVLNGMRAGGTRTAVVPAWLLTTDRYTSQKEYLDACSSSTSLIYTITFSEQTDDIDKWETEKGNRYALEHSLKNTSFNSESEDEDKIFWFLSNAASITGQTPIASGSKIQVNYTGSLLNGQVFDTTLEKVAKDNGIYSSGRKYEPVTITTADTYDKYAMNGSTSLVDGFKGALSLMQYPGEKAVAVFTSALGYAANGNGSSIPAYAPLRFDFEIVSVSE